MCWIWWKSANRYSSLPQKDNHTKRRTWNIKDKSVAWANNDENFERLLLCYSLSKFYFSSITLVVLTHRHHIASHVSTLKTVHVCLIQVFCARYQSQFTIVRHFSGISFHLCRVYALHPINDSWISSGLPERKRDCALLNNGEEISTSIYRLSGLQSPSRPVFLLLIGVQQTSAQRY